MNDTIHGGAKTYWLIEYVGGIPCPVYVQAEGSFHTCDPWKARRFASREEAELYMGNGQHVKFANPWMAVEHLFYGE